VIGAPIRHSGASRTKSPGAILNSRRLARRAEYRKYSVIQHITDFILSNYLDPGFRRGDEAFFNKLLKTYLKNGSARPAHRSIA
jgi:hypothetical protein